jgi:hypothetical protein
MGLNQKQGYANVLVVNTGSAIVVKDLTSIVTNANLSGYSNEIIKNTALDAYDRIRQVASGRTVAYLGLMTSMLNKMKVTINMTVATKT